MEPKRKLYLPFDPYRGIESFRYADRDIFSERDQEKLQLYNLINVYRGCLLYGKSGIGKSSLIAAGLIPLLEGYYQPEIIRVYPSDSGTFIISKILIADDTEANASSKFEPKNYKSSIFDPDNKYEHKITLSYSEFENIIKQQKTDNSIPVLIFDQFEELITLFEETTQTGQEEKLTNTKRLELQENIIMLLQELYFNSRLRVKIVLAFREDYLAKFDKLFYAIPDINKFFIRITALPKNRLKNIVSYPFNQDPECKLYKPSFSSSFEKMLINKLLKHFGEDDIVLTDVQIVCYFLYKRQQADRERHLNEDDAISKILELFYRDILDRFDKREKPVAIAILFILVLNERTRNIFHHDLIIAEYLKEIDRQEPGIAEPYIEICESVLLNLENKARIIRKEERKGGYYYEISSEAIIPYINQLKVAKEKEDLIKEKEKEARIEQKKRRRELMYIAGISLLIIIGVFLFFYQQHLNVVREQQRKTKYQEQQKKQYINDLAIAKAHAYTDSVLTRKAELQAKKADTATKKATQYANSLNTALEHTKLLERTTEQEYQEVKAAKSIQEKSAQETKAAQTALYATAVRDSVNLLKRLDSLKALYKSLAYADTSLKVNNPASKQKFAILAYESLPKTLRANDAFIPQVYSALTAVLKSSLKNKSLYAAIKNKGYKNINDILNIHGKLYFNMPFTGIKDTSKNSALTDPTLLRSWINPKGTILLSFVVNNNMTKRLLMRDININNGSLGPVRDVKIPALAANQDIFSLIFDPVNNVCIYSTRFPVAVYKLNLANPEKTVPIKLSQNLKNDEYMLLANRGGYFSGISNLGNYMLWSNYTSDEPQSIKQQRGTNGDIVTAVAYGNLNYKTLFAGCENGDIYKIDSANNIRKFYSPTNTSTAITCLSSSPDGKWLAAGFFDGTIKLWRLDAKELVSADIDLGNHPPDGVSALAFNFRDKVLNLIASTDHGYVYHLPLSIAALFKLFPARVSNH